VGGIDLQNKDVLGIVGGTGSDAFFRNTILVLGGFCCFIGVCLYRRKRKHSTSKYLSPYEIWMANEENKVKGVITPHIEGPKKTPKVNPDSTKMKNLHADLGTKVAFAKGAAPQPEVRASDIGVDDLYSQRDSKVVGGAFMSDVETSDLYVGEEDYDPYASGPAASTVNPLFYANDIKNSADSDEDMHDESNEADFDDVSPEYGASDEEGAESKDAPLSHDVYDASNEFSAMNEDGAGNGDVPLSYNIYDETDEYGATNTEGAGNNDDQSYDFYNAKDGVGIDQVPDAKSKVVPPPPLGARVTAFNPLGQKKGRRKLGL